MVRSCQGWSADRRPLHDPVCGTRNRAAIHSAGEPDQNAFIERLNRTYRIEVLTAYVFESLEQVREISAEWLQSYNDERPNEALADFPASDVSRPTSERRSSPLAVSR